MAASSIVAWGLAVAPRGSGALAPVGFGDPSAVPFWSEHVGMIWLYGMIVVQVILLFLPKRWFRITVDDDIRPAAHAPAASGTADGTDTGNTAQDKEVQ